MKLAKLGFGTLALTALLCSVGCSSIKGSVFLITVGGDLKPARLATVYILPVDVVPNADLLSKKETEIRDECGTLDYMRSYHGGGSGSLDRYIQDYDNVLSSLEKMIQSNAASKGFMLLANEDGSFSRLVMKPGDYEVVAFGQAGINKGYWVSKIQLGPGERKEIKMTAPTMSCNVLPM